jgi:hypothetical protein
VTHSLSASHETSDDEDDDDEEDDKEKDGDDAGDDEGGAGIHGGQTAKPDIVPSLQGPFATR